MKPRSALAQGLPRSGIREVMDLARQMDDVIVLVVGEPSFNTPAHIIDAAAVAAHGGTTKYAADEGADHQQPIEPNGRGLPRGDRALAGRAGQEARPLAHLGRDL